MLHIVKLIERRFPAHAGRIAPYLLLLTTLGLLLGPGLLYRW